MSSPLSEVDRELLGEIPHSNGAEATMTKADGFEGSQGAEFHPLNATAGTLVKVSSKGDELEPGHMIRTISLLSLTYFTLSPHTMLQPNRLHPHTLHSGSKHVRCTSLGNAQAPFEVYNLSPNIIALLLRDTLDSSKLPSDQRLFTFNIPQLTTQAHQNTVVEDTKAVPKTPKKRGAAAAANDDSAQPTKKRSPVKKALAATNLDANTNGDSTEPITPPKKRASPKKKNATDVKIDTDTGEPDGETEGQEPVTPKKGKPATAKGKATKAEDDAKTNGRSTETTDKSVSPTKGNGEIEGTTIHNTPRKRQAPKKELAQPRGIPSSWDNADHADRMLVTMKENGEGWTEIRAAWKKATGQDTAPSTLPNRYNRIKVNMLRLKEGDEKHLFAAKKEIEDAHAATFWANVAANMERRGADKYPVAFIQKTFKELEAASKTDLNAATTNDTDDTSGAKDDDVIMKEEDTGDKGEDEA